MNANKYGFGCSAWLYSSYINKTSRAKMLLYKYLHCQIYFGGIIITALIKFNGNIDTDILMLHSHRE